MPSESPFEEPSYETVGKGFVCIDRRVHRNELPDTSTARECCERCHERGLVESIIQAAEEAVANANPPGVPGIYRRDLEEAISDYRKEYLDA